MSDIKLFYKQYNGIPSCDIPFEPINPFKELTEMYSDCTQCALHTKRINPVFGDGELKPLIMFVGLSPSQYNSEIGSPYVDKAGEKLSGMINYLGRKLTIINNTYATYLTLCPPDGPGTPNVEQLVACYNRFKLEVSIVNPYFIVALGEKVAQFITHKGYDINYFRQMKNTVEIDKFYTMFVTYSPEELLYKNDEIKQEVKKDLDYIIKYVK